MVPLLPLIQSIPLHIETTRSHIKDLLAENVTLLSKLDLNTSDSRAGLGPPKSISEKARKKRPSSPSTTETLSSPSPNKRLRTGSTSKEPSRTIDEIAHSLPSGNARSQRNASPPRAVITPFARNDSSDDSNASQPNCPASTVSHTITETPTQDTTSNAQIPTRPPVLSDKQSPYPSPGTTPLAKAPSAIPRTIVPQSPTSSSAQLGIQPNSSFYAPAAPSLLTPSRHNTENKAPTPPVSSSENQKVVPPRLFGAKDSALPMTNPTTKALRPVPVAITRRQTRAQTLRTNTRSISSSGSNKPPVATSISGHKSRLGNISAPPNNILQRQATDANFIFWKITEPTEIPEITKPIRRRRSPFVSVFVLHVSCLTRPISREMEDGSSR